jgi:hypothetical protein
MLPCKYQGPQTMGTSARTRGTALAKGRLVATNLYPDLMKYFLLIGGFCGFFVVFASGIAAGNDLSNVLQNATIGCMIGALAMRGFRMLLTYQVRQVTTQQAQVSSAGAVTATPE